MQLHKKWLVDVDVLSISWSLWIHMGSLVSKSFSNYSDLEKGFEPSIRKFCSTQRDHRLHHLLLLTIYSLQKDYSLRAPVNEHMSHYSLVFLTKMKVADIFIYLFFFSDFTIVGITISFYLYFYLCNVLISLLYLNYIPI